MRNSCLGRTTLLALLLLVVVLSAMRGVAGSWEATPVAAIDWQGLGAGIGSGLESVAGAAADLLGRLVGAIWSGLSAIPWLGAGAAVAGFVGDLGAGFVALLRDLGSGLLAIVGNVGQGAVDLVVAGWNGVVDRVRALAYSPTGEPLDRGRLALFAAGWVVVLIVVGWLAIRLMVGGLRALRERITNRGCSPSRSRSHARV